MNTSESFEALRRANPRSKAAFAQSVETAGERVHARIAAAPTATVRRRRLRVTAAGAAVAVVAVVAALVTVGSPGGETATAAVERAATTTAASAERSGTAVVRITHDGEVWAGSTIRWNGDDVSIVREAASFPGRPGRKVGDELRVVHGTVYGIDPDGGGWVAQGSPRNIDPDSGTTPDEYLAAVREDIGGVTLRRITGGMTGLTTTHLDDGSTVYTGTVAAGLIARETGFKEGESIRVLPFGYVAHGKAEDAAAPLDAAVTVGADGVVREIAVAWGPWSYSVAYSKLGSTDAPVAPADARSLLKERGLRG